MMNDKPRNDAYYAALSSAISSETHVLDIGSGAGLLAMMSARLGAARVDACEMVPRIAAVTKEIVRDNGFDKVIHVHGKVSTRLEVGIDLPKRANLVVSEIFSSELVGKEFCRQLKTRRGDLSSVMQRLFQLPPRFGLHCLRAMKSSRIYSLIASTDSMCDDLTLPWLRRSCCTVMILT